MIRPTSLFMLRLLGLTAWVWLVCALPFLTNTSVDLLARFLLSLTWLVLALAWIAVPFVSFRVLRSPTGRNWWVSAATAGLVGLFLSLTDFGLIVRLKLCESSLSEYAAEIADHGGEWQHQPQRIGLFLVNGEEIDSGIIRIYISQAFLNREGLAYVPPGVEPHHQMRHLSGRWYWFYWKF